MLNSALSKMLCRCYSNTFLASVYNLQDIDKWLPQITGSRLLQLLVCVAIASVVDDPTGLKPEEVPFPESCNDSSILGRSDAKTTLEVAKVGTAEYQNLLKADETVP